MHETLQLGSRIAILGRGGVDADSAAQRLADLTGRPLIRIDKHFWPVDRREEPAAHWAAVQSTLAENDTWVLDADLGPFDLDEPRLGHPDEIWVLDYSPITCLLRALRYPSERRDLRVWLLRWRREYLNAELKRIAAHAPDVRLRRFGSPAELAAVLEAVGASHQVAVDPV
jgi:hypothetical protein